MTEILRVGKIITTFGIKGELKVFPTTDDIKRFDKLKNIYLLTDENAGKITDDDKKFEIANVKYVKDNPIIKINGIDKVEDATKYVGKNIYISRDDAVPLKENEYFVIDLMGLNVYLNDKIFGTVKDVMKTKANDILVVNNSEKEILIPMVSDFIEEIDIKKSILKVKNIEGLI